MALTELTKQYDPRSIEERIYAYWIEQGVFPPRDGEGAAYTIVIPPPNITGQLHMGHALNNTLQDILIRWQRMKGKRTLWLPGTDHAGIATQVVVERELGKKGVKRHDLGREKFLEKVWEWREQYGSTIVRQLKRIGASCDWDRMRFTLDEGLSRAVRKVFCDLYAKGWIYRGSYIVNWCPKDRTALSDEEVEHEETAGKLWYVTYPGVGPGAGSITVATTRPETMLGDVAVAVHPDDERYRDMIGRMVRLPVVDRDIPVIGDSFVDPKFGTGAVKITPAHDPNDFLAGQRNGLTPLVVMNPDGTINENGKPFTGLDRFACRAEMVKRLEELGLLVKVEPHVHAVGHCYRCHSVVEPYLSTQWFAKMADMARPAMEVVRSGRVRFHPERWTKVYFDWMENIHDWCISRQLWWGHRIPAYYCRGCKALVVSEEPPKRCDKCGLTFFDQDEDVLDTWFSSALWPFSTMGWPDKTADLEGFYPTSTLVTDRGIIFFWVARMIMSGLEFTGTIPFSDVYIHGTVLDSQGRRMSKSLGNGIDPIEVVEEYGADAMRFSLMMLSSGGQDIKLSKDKFEMGRNFANKLWNAARFLMMYLSDASGELPEEEPDGLEFVDRWILSRLSRLESTAESTLTEFDFYGSAKSFYDFVWHEYCDWYVEFIKPRLSTGNADTASKSVDPGGSQGSRSRRAALWTARHVFRSVLKLLHPFMPYITEEIHQHLASSTGPLARSAWPQAGGGRVDPAVEGAMERVQAVVSAVQRIRSAFTTKDSSLKPTSEVDVLVRADPKGKWSALIEHQALVKSRARARTLDVRTDVAAPAGSASEIVEDIEVYVPLAGFIDYKKEEERLTKDLSSKKRDLEIVQKKLSQESFVKNAPPEIVEKEKNKQEEILLALRKIENLLSSLRQRS